MSTVTLAGELARLRAAFETRHVDQEIVLLSHAYSRDPKKPGHCVCGAAGHHGQEELLRAGGRWDKLYRRLDGPAAAPHTFAVKWSQEQAARRFAEWCRQRDAGDESRVSLEFYADNRRGGKTFWVCLLVVLFLLRYPRKEDGAAQVAWLVVSRYPKQREILETLRKILPRGWLGGDRPLWRWRKSDRVFTLPSGAELYIKSGDDAELLKEGGVPCIGINEAQEISGVGVIHCIGNNIDGGGLTAVALNPPERAIGLWAMNVHEAIKSGAMKYARLTPFPPSGNDAIDQSARGRFQEVAHVIDPKQAQRDGLGLWVAIGDLCYPTFSKAIHVVPASTFAGWPDITAEMNALTEYLPKGDLRPWGAGMDFQRRPWCGAVKGKALAAPEGNPFKLAPGTPVYVMFEECTNDITIGEWWHEDRLCQEMLARGWDPKDLLVIGDGTGRSQGASARQRGRDADPSTFSFAIVERYGYEIHAPLEREEWQHRSRQGSLQQIHAMNPPVPVRLNTTLTLLDQLAPRLFIVSECGRDPKLPGGMTAESFRICEASAAKKPRGRGAHLTDAVGYLTYRWEESWRAARGEPPLYVPGATLAAA